MTTFIINDDTYDARTCGKCGCKIIMLAYVWKARQDDGETFYCPNGHPRAFAETTADKLRQERDRLAQQIAERDDAVRIERERREAAERRENAAKGQVTKLRKRASAGVCPCCNRTFIALQRHMTQKHPGFTAEDSNVVELKTRA